MTESTSEYKKRIEEIKQSIENEPYMAKMREDIAEGISKTGIRQATVEEQFQDVQDHYEATVQEKFQNIDDQFQAVIDETTGKDVISAPELIAARNGKSNLKTRLDDEHAQVTAQLQQTAKDINQERINVISHGVIGDGIADDTQAIKVLISGLTPSDTLLFPRGYTFNVSDTIHFPIQVNIIMESPIVYTGSEHIPIIIVGEKGVANVRVHLELMAKKETISDWDNNNSKAIQVINLYQSHLTIRRTENTTIGAELIGSGRGFVYNTITMYDMHSHKIALKLTNEQHGTSIGWINENLFLNGRFGHYSGQKLNESRYGVWITSEDQTYGNNNNNVFIKPSFELAERDLVTAGEAIPIVVEHGSQNEFYSIRNEGNSITTARFMNTSTENYISVGYGTGSIDDTSINTMNYLTSKRYNYSKWTQVFNSGLLSKHAVIDGDNTSFDNVNVVLTDGRPINGYTLITVDATSINMASTRGVSVRLHTRDIELIAVKRDSLANGRVAIIAYDDQGNRLTGSDPMYIKSPTSMTLAPQSSLGGSYITGSDHNRTVTFSTSDEVAYVDVIVTKGDLRGFVIETYGGMSIPYKV